MNTLHSIRFTALIALSLASVAVSAQEKDCLTLTTQSQIEQDVVDAQGKTTKRLVAPGKVTPGNEIVWVITAQNKCSKPAEKVVINNNVPAQMTYVANSAAGKDATISYSLDGRDYGKQNELVVREADGKPRPARADEIKAVRWVVASIAPNTTTTVRYTAKVN
jgi:uncharacterized repeat protein (TIGR01451 family)